MPEPGQVIAYHYIRSGRLWAQVEGYPVGRGGAGIDPDVPAQRSATCSSPTPDLPPIDCHDICGSAGRRSLARVRIDNPGEEVDFCCGFLGVVGGATTR